MSKTMPKNTSKSTVKSNVQDKTSSQRPPNRQETIQEPMIAHPMERVIAIVYDGMLILALLFLVGTVLTVIGTLLTMQTGTDSAQAQSLPTWYQNFIMTPSFVLTLVGFYGLFWRRGGQTLGMQTWRLKTVNNDGHLLTWGQSFKRILAACLMPVLCIVIVFLSYRTVLCIVISFPILQNCYIHCKYISYRNKLYCILYPYSYHIKMLCTL